MNRPVNSLMKRLPALIAPLACLAMSGCNMVVLNPAGDVAVRQRDLVIASTVLMLLIIIPVIALSLFFAWHYRASNENARYEPDWDHSTQLELVIWSAPLLIIICLGALTWVGTHLLDPYRPISRVGPGHAIAANVKPLEVEVVALDWKWLFIYPQYGIATVNELAAPVDRPIQFKITSSSVMNSFFVPALAGQIYAMPGMQTSLSAVINKPGEYEGISANYSGAGFSGMHFKFHGLDQAGFDGWVKSVKAGGTLGRSDYLTLEQPSENVPVMRYASVMPGLFAAVVNECVRPGTACMSDLMAKDAARDAAPSPDDSAAPAQPGKPVGALLKPSGEKGTSPNIDAPGAPAKAPGNAKPGAAENRNLTLNVHPSAPARA